MYETQICPQETDLQRKTCTALTLSFLIVQVTCVAAHQVKLYRSNMICKYICAVCVYTHVLFILKKVHECLHTYTVYGVKSKYLQCNSLNFREEHLIFHCSTHL